MKTQQTKPQQKPDVQKRETTGIFNSETGKRIKEDDKDGFRNAFRKRAIVINL